MYLGGGCESHRNESACCGGAEKKEMLVSVANRNVHRETRQKTTLLLHPVATDPPSIKILSAFASLIPLMVHNVFFGVNATASTVWKPASASFLISDAEIPASYGPENERR